MPPPEFDVVPPDAPSMLMSLRGVGYSLPTAIADIVDNSIAAEAKTIWIDFHWASGASTITILDDGRGMEASELLSAMRLGGRSPLDQRHANDLGRFGLGLKTASFSQCRRLTVASKKAGKTSIRRWDLDYIVKHSKGWSLLPDAAPGSEHLLAPLEKLDAGTLVAWEILDRITGTDESEVDLTEKAFLEAIDHTEQHLAMVFHRFLAGAKPLNIFLNGIENRNRVRAWDPFLADHPTTLRRPIQPIATRVGTIEVQGFILPHKDRLDKKQYKRAEGPDGWTAQQGFYVYRNNRLLVAGHWLGLGPGRMWTKEEAHKLARLRLDIPNTADEEWKIDIKKSTARPPGYLRPRLRMLAEDVREAARRVFAHRGNYGPRGATPDLARAWISVDREDSVSYRIDRKHPAVTLVLEKGGETAPQVEAMLRIIEETVPVQKIWLDTVEKGQLQHEPRTDEPPKDAATIIDILYRDLRDRIGISPAEAKKQLLRTEPFNAYPALVQGLPDN